jgi:hypothetical protein
VISDKERKNRFGAENHEMEKFTPLHGGHGGAGGSDVLHTVEGPFHGNPVGGFKERGLTFCAAGASSHGSVCRL